MSEATPTTAPVVEPVAAETVAAPATTEAPAAVEPVVEAPAATEAAPVTTEAAPATEEATEAVAEKAVEPITEGQLAYKGPGLVKSLIPSKKEFWLSDAAVEPENLSLFLRGEKPEVAHPVVAWASQTGKGLLFFNKKSETDRLHPADVLPLYDATDLKKEAQHQFAFKIGTHTHTFKATTDAERDGWYLSIEKAIELSKASKEEIQSSEGYKAELEKLTKPAAPVVAAAATTEKKKSRSTSRGLLNRLKNTKEETEEKKEEAKAEEKAEAPAAAVVEPEAPGAGEIAPAVVAVPAETAEETPVAAEAATETPATEAKAEEKPKVSKRQSIFGKFSLKSPSKEKDQKEAELGAAPVSENPPVLPETATTEAAAAEPAAAVVGEPVVTDEAAAEAPKDVAAAETVSPTKEKTNFLSSFIKRSRSVSPSTALKEETPIAATTETPAAAPAATEETPVVAAAEPAAATEAPAATTEAAATEEARPEPTKRQSVLGSLGRRASKAFKGINAKKEPTSPTAATAEEATEEAAPAAATTEEVKAAEKEEAPAAIADVVPEAVTVGEAPKTTPVVAASA